MIEAAIARIEAHVPALVGRTKPAADLTALIAKNALPQHTPAAFVIPSGIRGGSADAAAGLFRQHVEEVVSVLMTFRSTANAGDRAVALVQPIIRAVIEALAGWAPGDEVPGVFRLVRGQVLSFAGGTLVYQIDFAIDDQLRIAT